MTKEDCVKCLSILRVNYPTSFSKLDKHDAENLVYLWQESFRDYPYQIVVGAVLDLIQTKPEWAPDIAAVKARIGEMTEAVSGDPTDQELWDLLTKAVSNGSYGFREEFDKLPEALRIFVGSPGGLRDLAALDTEVMQTVTRGQFFRQIETIRKRQDLAKRMAPGLKQVIEAYAARTRLPGPPEKQTPEQINARKNQLAERLG